MATPESPAIDGSEGHWRRTYLESPPEELSWAERIPAVSLALISDAALPLDAALIDVGGGASGLAGELLGRGYRDVTVADISAEALEHARRRVGADAARVTWVQADVRDHDFGRRFDLWHDRAVFHFMVEEHDRDAYLRTLDRTLAPGGNLVLATFGPQGPTECSGLPVRRYEEAEIVELLGPEFELRSSLLHLHRTPGGAAQQFLYVRFKRRGNGCSR